jgi:hypothetical protein
VREAQPPHLMTARPGQRSLFVQAYRPLLNSSRHPSERAATMTGMRTLAGTSVATGPRRGGRNQRLDLQDLVSSDSQFAEDSKM